MVIGLGWVGSTAENSNWQTSVVAALSTYASSRFRSGKELRGALNGFWTLLDVVAPSEVEPSISRRADYRFSAEGTLIPLEPDRKGRRRHDGHGEGEAAREQEREARRLRKQMRKLAASYVFSNLDCSHFVVRSRLILQLIDLIPVVRWAFRSCPLTRRPRSKSSPPMAGPWATKRVTAWRGPLMALIEAASGTLRCASRPPRPRNTSGTLS